MINNILTLETESLTFFQSKFYNLGNSVGIKVNEYDMDLFIDPEKEIQKVEAFLMSNKNWYPFGAHFNIDLNLIKLNNILHFELDFESGRKIRVPVEWENFKKNLQDFTKKV